MSAADGEVHEVNRKWEGYSNYELVSKLIAQNVSDCISGYALMQSYQAEGAKAQPEQIAKERASILQAAIRLRVELRSEKDTNERYQEILKKWEGEDGYISNFQSLEIHQSGRMPEWVADFVDQIVESAWELGYLQAGRTARKEPDDPIERDTEAMFEGI